MSQKYNTINDYCISRKEDRHSLEDYVCLLLKENIITRDLKFGGDAHGFFFIGIVFGYHNFALTIQSTETCKFVYSTVLRIKILLNALIRI